LSANLLRVEGCAELSRVGTVQSRDECALELLGAVVQGAVDTPKGVLLGFNQGKAYPGLSAPH
jgi:hypothetical protein